MGHVTKNYVARRQVDKGKLRIPLLTILGDELSIANASIAGNVCSFATHFPLPV